MEALRSGRDIEEGSSQSQRCTPSLFTSSLVIDPSISEYYPDGSPLDAEPTHMVLLLGCFEFEDRVQVEDPSHPDAQHLRETDGDRERLEKFINFYRNRGARRMKSEHFEWAWSIDMNPCYLRVSAALALH